MVLQQTADGFLHIITENKGLIYKVAHLYCRNEEDRKDLCQEIIFQLWRSFQRYDEQYKLSTWMYKIALNVAISFYRKGQRHARAQPLTADLLQLVPDKEPDGTEQQIQLLRQYINTLHELDRALMILYLEEKSHKEMADILGLTTTNVATRIGRVKEKLKQKFANTNN
jgi:RNA polymerase sigma-70 factor (ECF subfamily)